MALCRFSTYAAHRNGALQKKYVCTLHYSIPNLFAHWTVAAGVHCHPLNLSKRHSGLHIPVPATQNLLHTYDFIFGSAVTLSRVRRSSSCPQEEDASVCELGYNLTIFRL